jgi:hypothetical protein
MSSYEKSTCINTLKFSLFILLNFLSFFDLVVFFKARNFVSMVTQIKSLVLFTVT